MRSICVKGDRMGIPDLRSAHMRNICVRGPDWYKKETGTAERAGAGSSREKEGKAGDEAGVPVGEKRENAAVKLRRMRRSKRQRKAGHKAEQFERGTAENGADTAG